MGVGTLTIYSASAGSGKTHRLAGAYLEKLFKSRHSYRKILAVTFTHKATAEMKDRILEELNKLSVGEESKFLEDLVKSTGKSEESIRNEAKDILFSLLHDFSRFSVSTIDSFYQKIIRAFARDIGLHSGFNIEVDSSLILASAIDRMIDSASTDITLRNWLSMFARSNIEEGKSWDLRKSIAGLAGELFTEKFKLLSGEEKKKLLDKDFLKSYIKEMRRIVETFKGKMKDCGLRSLEIYNKYDLREEMFFQRGRGIPGYIKSLAEGEIKSPNSYVKAVTDNPPKWSTGKMSVQLSAALSSGMRESVIESINYFNNNYVEYKTASIILSNIYILGIFTNVMDKIREITNDENVFLLSDAGELIYLITEKDQASFIYEKIGNTFENFMIDEFQDTSVIQWNNFRQLIDNSMAQGFDNLVVGDIKQSIYRWRNSDWKTLSELRNKVDGRRYIYKSLDTNWRSCANIIRFNNSLFSIIPFMIDTGISDHKPSTGFSDLFSESVQKDPLKKQGGYVRIEFVENSDHSDWKKTVLDKLPGVIEGIQDKGYSASDIGILVRDNKEGALILKHIIDYSAVCDEEKKKKYNYNIVSAESLLLINSPVINFIIATLRVLENPDDMIGRALMLRYFFLATGKDDAHKIPLNSEELIEYAGNFFPAGYNDFLNEIRYLPLWDIAENTIRFFGLGDHSFNVAYLSSFQDVIVNYASLRNPGISSFLEWWESEGIKKSIILPEQQDSMKVLTIHKSKGLEFMIVILPYISWNLDHKSFQNNIIWVEPDMRPFNRLGIVPVRYKSELADTIFADQFFDERYAAYLDNINLLYVAFTRAVDAIIGFAPDKPQNDNRIADILREAICFEGEIKGKPDIFLYRNYSKLTKVFEYGSIPEIKTSQPFREGPVILRYKVNDNTGKLKIKLHWEDYFVADKSGVRARINHGKIMHEIFSEIYTPDHVPSAVRKKVIEGKITEADEAEINGKIEELLKHPVVKDWFKDYDEILMEKSILMPDSFTKRPDRVLIKDGKAVIIDFKFGDESHHHINQIIQYKKALMSMGYGKVEAYLWYFEKDKIVNV